MKPKINDKIHFLCCSLDAGHYAEEYSLVEIASDHIKLRHTSTVRKSGVESGTDKISRHALDVLKEFAIPYNERLKKLDKHFNDVDWLCKQLTLKEEG